MKANTTPNPLPETLNPFSTSRTRPGAIPFRFAPGDDAKGLTQRLQQHGWRGQIVGPHGSGKSTLLARLLAEFEDRGTRYARAALHDGQRRLPESFWRVLKQPQTKLAVVDGYEQLGRLARLNLRWYCKRAGKGLLVTTHASVGLPQVYDARPDFNRVRSIVKGLVRGFPPLVADADVAQCYRRYHPDVREMLFALYDLYESRRGRTDSPLHP